MKFLIIVLLLTLVQSKKKINYESSESESSESSDYIPDVETTIDYRGTVRKRFALLLALQGEGQNLICSPLSAILPLSKLALGAKKYSKAQTELYDAVGFKTKGELNSYNKQLIKDIEYLKGVEVDLASRIYVSKKKRLNKKFKHHAQSVFGSAVELVDMENPLETAKTINDWVYEHTNKKINGIISAKEITEDSSLILVNAIYFQGKWKYPFSPARMSNFHGSNGVSYQAPMMTKIGANYNYIKYDPLNAEILEIPYVGEESAMIIVLPYSANGLPILLRTLKLSPDLLNDALKNMKSETVDVTIPKFKIETMLDLKYYYSKMGIKKVMKPDCGLDNIVKDESVYISSAIQRAVIEVTETGTEAAAATALNFIAVIKHLHVIKFVADRPFLFYVKANFEQLFSGVVYKP